MLGSWENNIKKLCKKKNVKSKGNNDWVTNQDILIEKKIIQIIKMTRRYTQK